jgi:hypothetical protein
MPRGDTLTTDTLTQPYVKTSGTATGGRFSQVEVDDSRGSTFTARRTRPSTSSKARSPAPPPELSDLLDH